MGLQTEWTSLAKHVPENGAVCDWKVHSAEWSASGRGNWYEQPPIAGFSDSHGLMISDPAITYWRAPMGQAPGDTK